MSSRAWLATFALAAVLLAAGAVFQPLGAVANGVSVQGGASGVLSPHLSDPATSAVANPTTTAWSNSSVIEVTTSSTGTVSYGADPSSDPAVGCAVDGSGTVSATGAGDCTIDVSVDQDSTYSASSTTAVVHFTPAAATTSALAAPSSTAWSNTSAIQVTTNSTGQVSYSVDSSSTAPGCSVNSSGVASASGVGTCVVDVSVAADANYIVSTAQATVSFTAISGGGGGGGGAGPTSITQTPPTTAAVSVSASGAFTAGPISVQGNTGPVTFKVTSANSGLAVSSSGQITTTGELAGGTYSVSGTDSDSHGDSGIWTFTLAVSASVTFLANGGKGTMSAQASSAPSALSLNAFTRKGYTFIGWNTSPKGTGVSYANGAAFPFTSNTELFARWKEGSLPRETITFRANGGSGHMAAEVENAPTAIKANHFTRHGYHFVTWRTTARGEGQIHKPGSTYAFKKSITLFARWEKDAAKAPTSPKPPKAPIPTHVVTYFANGGTGKMTAEVRRGSAALKSNAFSRRGYTFVGWNTKPDGKGVGYPIGATYSFKRSLSLYAQWKKDLVVPLPIAGGTVVGPFAPQSSTLTAALESQLRGLAVLAKAKSATQITLYGCGDAVGSTSSANVALGRARAGAVATYLEGRLGQIGLKGWTISISTASPSPDEVGSVVVTLN